MKKTGIFLLMLLISQIAWAQFKISGKVLQTDNKQPIDNAVVLIPERNIWAITDQKGNFTFSSLSYGNITLRVDHLGFERYRQELKIDQDITQFLISLNADNLTLKEVTVTARKTNETTTSYTIQQKALEHMQMLSLTDVASLLPGGKTNNYNHLVQGPQMFAINGYSGEKGNALFGVGVEVDGQRLSANAQPGTSGIDVRNIASSNVESVEIITGLPSVEIGDATNGVVKINTRKGKSKYLIDLITKPNTKQVALSKGYTLGLSTLNVNLEHAKSISDLTSPYTAYERNSLSLAYGKTFFRTTLPLAFEWNVTGNTGGYNSSSDPDLFVNTYSKSKDDVIRSNVSAKWLLNKKWITNLEVYAGVHYNNTFSEVSSNKSAASSVAALHVMDKGYFVGERYAENPNAPFLLIEPGYWYEIGYTDSKALNYNAKIKADKSIAWENVTTNFKLGIEYSGSQNRGKGKYYDDIRYAPTWRAYPYYAIPSQNNISVFAEDKLDLKLANRELQLTAGVRGDWTIVEGSDYGSVQNIAPRVSGKYNLWNSKNSFIKHLDIRAGWGKTVKLPSFSTLFPAPNYRDILTFAPGTTADGKTYYAYYTQPILPIYNPNLKWQSNQQFELGLGGNIAGNRISLTYAKDRTYNTYITQSNYTPFTYKFTNQSGLEKINIPAENRRYEVDQETGIVTVVDKTGELASQTVNYTEITRFYSNTMPDNGSPVERERLSWMVDFKAISPIKTSFRVDGNYYRYKGVDQVIQASMPNSTLSMSDGTPYSLIGYYVGNAGWSNGSLSKSVDMNVTAITHIPVVKMIMSLRLETSLYSYSRVLSQYKNQAWGEVLDGRESYTPSETLKDIYGGDRFVAVYPLYYTSLNDLNTPIPFKETFLWAQKNDPALYNDLAKLVVKTNYNYSFNPNKVSAYYSVNLGITKEIGDLASITFNAVNFINNLAKVRNSSTQSETSLYGTSYIPSFYYGLSMKLKI